MYQYRILAGLFLCNTNNMTSASAEKSLELSLDESAKESDDEDDDDDNGSVEEGSDAMETSSEDSDSDHEEEKNVTKKPPPEASLKVNMEAKDVPSAPGLPSVLDEVCTLVDGTGHKKADRAVKDRIIRLLNTLCHESNQNKAKNTIKLAQRLMKKHDLSQASLLKERQDKNENEQNSGSANDESLKGGIVQVDIVNRKTDKPALFARWICNLMEPIENNFDVNSYYTVSRERHCKVVFYGIYTSCQLAAYNFCQATEKISQMTAAYKRSNRSGRVSGDNFSKKRYKLSYAMGIVEGINKKVEEERQERKSQSARLAATKDDDACGVSDEDKKPAAKGSTVAEEDNDNDSDDESLSQTGKPSAKAKLAADRRLQELENLQQAEITLAVHCERIERQVLENKGIRVTRDARGNMKGHNVYPWNG
jgi:hypothetical protein